MFARQDPSFDATAGAGRAAYAWHLQHLEVSKGSNCQEAYDHRSGRRCPLTPGTDVTGQESGCDGCSSGMETKRSVVAPDDVPRRTSSNSS